MNETEINQFVSDLIENTIQPRTATEIRDDATGTDPESGSTLSDLLDKISVKGDETQ